MSMFLTIDVMMEQEQVDIDVVEDLDGGVPTAVVNVESLSVCVSVTKWNVHQNLYLRLRLRKI